MSESGPAMMILRVIDRWLSTKSDRRAEHRILLGLRRAAKRLLPWWSLALGQARAQRIYDFLQLKEL